MFHLETFLNEGDLIYFPKGTSCLRLPLLTMMTLSIKYRISPTYKLKCKTFEYASEVIDTGIAEIDAIETDNSLDMLSHQMTLEDGSGSLILENAVEGAAASYIILETYNIATIDENSQNEDFEIADDNILDFTETNPFGDAGMR